MPDFCLDDELIDVPARFLVAPRLQCWLQTRRNRKLPHNFQRGFTTAQTASWNLLNIRFYQHGTIDHLNVYNLDNPVYNNQI
jgi:hypothetical protein